MTDHGGNDPKVRPVTRGRYPGYDVLAKRDSASWNDRTRVAIAERLAVEDRPMFLDQAAWRALQALCDRVMPQPAGRPRVPVAAMVDRHIASGKSHGYRLKDMPPAAEAWQRALTALDEAATAEWGRVFADLPAADQDAMLTRMKDGTLQAAALRGMPAQTFWKAHVDRDVSGSYYAHPTAWSEMGWGGPASPRGYVRLDNDRRDPWEPEEATPGKEARAERENKRVR